MKFFKLMSEKTINKKKKFKLKKADEALLNNNKFLDEKLKNKEKFIERESNNKEKQKFIVAVIGCPSGIANTYMAADSLRKKAREFGVNIKIETKSLKGTKNYLTAEDIKKADGIIIASSCDGLMERFCGKKILIVDTHKVIHCSQEIIGEALNGEGILYYENERVKKNHFKNFNMKTGYFYRHLINGVSSMIPFVVAGGMLIALSFIFGVNASNINDVNFNPIAKILNDIGKYNAFKLMIPVLAGFIGMSIAGKSGFAPAMTGGLIASKSGTGFLGGIIAGFLGGYIVFALKILFKDRDDKISKIKEVLVYPVLGVMLTGIIMYLIIVGPVNHINTLFTGFLCTLGVSKILLGIILGGMMAVDMGGPINKAAYTFGVAMIDSSNYLPQAAVMAGGMVPPLGCAIATILFKEKFSKEEINAGKTNFILGACFITEGAIPFAARDPIRVIPACVLGSSITGGLSMMFNIGVPAPHGGIFIFPAITGNIFLYMFSILVGAFISALLLGVFKKN